NSSEASDQEPSLLRRPAESLARCGRRSMRSASRPARLNGLSKGRRSSGTVRCTVGARTMSAALMLAKAGGATSFFRVVAVACGAILPGYGAVVVTAHARTHVHTGR